MFALILWQKESIFLSFKTWTAWDILKNKFFKNLDHTCQHRYVCTYFYMRCVRGYYHRMAIKATDLSTPQVFNLHSMTRVICCNILILPFNVAPAFWPFNVAPAFLPFKFSHLFFLGWVCEIFYSIFTLILLQKF